MGKVRGDLFGGYSGKIGNQYGRYVHGVNLNAIMPPKRGNMGKSAQEYDNQDLFAEVSRWAAKFAKPIEWGLKAYARSKNPLWSARNAFTHLNMTNQAFISSDGQVEIETPRVEFSKGNLEGLYGLRLESPNPNELYVYWDDINPYINGDPEDKVVGIFYNWDLDEVIVLNGEARKDTMTGPSVPNWVGCTCEAWVFLIGGGRHNKGMISDTFYAGKVDVI